MRKHILLTIGAFLAVSLSLFGQSRPIKGVVVEEPGGDTVVGASVMALDARGKVLTGVATNAGGQFSMNLPSAAERGDRRHHRFHDTDEGGQRRTGRRRGYGPGTHP